MLKYVNRAQEIAKNQGLVYLIKHSWRFLHVRYRQFNNFWRNHILTKQDCRVNTSGVVAARVFPNYLNHIIYSTQDTVNLELKFDRAAVIAHVFYPDLMDEFVSYIKNIPVKVGLFISTDTVEKKEIIQSIITESSLDIVELEIKIVPNRGRDIAPKLVAFRKVYDKYEVFLHLHSKKSLYSSDLGFSWRRYLLDNLIGSKEIAKKNLGLLSMEKIGVVYPVHHNAIKKHINWGYDYDIAKELLKRMGIELNVNHYLEFPSGSMFWARSAAIRPLLDLNLDFDDFPEEGGQIDGTLAHAVERIILYVVEKSGHEWVRISSSVSSKKNNINNYSFTPILGSENVPGVMQRIAYETNFILAAPHVSKKTRINLLIPTVEPSAIYGGISTAIKIFEEIVTKYGDGVDARIIVTDSRVINLPESLNNYCVQKIGAEQATSRVILDASDRNGYCLNTRISDIFVATAWWTAANAFKLHDMQKSFFGCAPKVVYLIQDYEPNFYGWSSKYALAESTYLRGQDTIAIINSEELTNFFEDRYRFYKVYYLPYSPNDKISSELISVERERILLFYARPTAARNCFEVGIDGIALWSNRNPVLASNWRIYCIGEHFSNKNTLYLENFSIKGKLSLEEYAQLLSMASVGVSLMLSPHPSYPPLEMAYSGLRTITNSYNYKDLSIRSKLITSLDILTPDSIADALGTQIEIAENIMIGNITPIRNNIKSIKTNEKQFDVNDLINEIKLNIKLIKL